MVMIGKRSVGLFGVVVGLALCAPRAQAADESGFVLGTRLGVARYPAAQTLGLGPDQLHGDRSDHVDLAWAVDVGYRFNRYFALQASYVDLGEASGTVRNHDSSAVAQATSAAEGAALTLIGSWPLDRWELYAIVGVFFNDTSSSVSGEVQGVPFSQRVSGEDEDTILGAGVAYRFADRARLKLDISSFNRVGESETTGRQGIAMAGIGLEWQF
jgi:OOP family OmpA-OmpF porin